MSDRFPHIVAAVEAREKHQRDAEGKDLWLIGAAVIKDCGTENIGNIKMLEAAAKELAKHGYDYNPSTLGDMAQTAHVFPVSRRHPELNFFTHTEARNPDLLDWIVKQVGKEKMSGRVAREWAKRWDTLRASKHKEQVEAAREQKQRATTPREKEAAEAKLAELGKPMPKAATTVPDKHSQSELAAMGKVLDIDSDAVWIVKTLTANLAKLRELDDVNPELIDALVEHHHQVVEKATQIADLLSKTRKGRFPVIRGGVA